MNLPPQLLGYLAGIVDGEGCITRQVSRTKNGQSVHPVITVSNGHRPLLEYLQTATGFGNIRSAHGKNSTLNPAFNWSTQKRQDVYTLLTSLLPLLIVKKKQALLALALLKLKSNSEEAKQLSEDLIKCNTRRGKWAR